MDIEVGKDPFHDNVFYFGYQVDPGEDAVIDFGDGAVTPIFPPRGQSTHQYDKAGKYTVTITRGKKRIASTTVTAQPGHTEAK